ncbi:acidic mammalian chitinase-like [Homarus americanus]|uniref:acidic mammalian chitinase-like n=1 Tax=Homarus americanus TaxID=6706 RepID=UPI001C47133C|nr:acidic mammalian chitinase-like [Homarus americanus]
MGRLRILLLLVGLHALLASGTEKGQKVVCYFSSWAVYRPGNGMFDVDNVDPFLCTELIFGFAGLSNHTWEIEVLDPWNELCPDEDGGDHCAYNRFTALKEINPDLTVLLAVGGWNEGSEDYSVMAEDPEKRKTFINSSVALVRKHNFDGLDVDWEYPAFRGGKPEDKENFVTLLTEFREAFDKFSPPLRLTGALSPGKPTIDDAYNVPALAKVFDLVNVMGYDYHGAWENFTHHNAPLCGYYLDWGEFIYFNVIYTINYYIDLGMPPEKMVLGIPAYGRCYTLDDIDNHGMLAPASEPGPAGPYIRIPGTLGANEICERLLTDDTCTVVHDPALHEPYFYCRSDNIWCSYDDVDSVYLKARAARNAGLDGVMVWTVDTDDFHAFCSDKDFPLIKSMKRAIQEPPSDDSVICNATASTTTTTPTTTTPTTTTPTTTTPTTTTPTTTTPTTTTPTTTTPTTTTPTTTTPTTTTTTTRTTTESTTTEHIPVTTRKPVMKPNCTGVPDGHCFPHPDCNKFWECISGASIVMMCAGGTVWDDTKKSCDWEDDVDTSGCHLWTCQVDNIYYPAADCNQYYWCYQGSPHMETCADGLYWNQNIPSCDSPANVNTDDCNPV